MMATTYDGKTLQKTLTDINPAADNAALKTWGEMLNGLTQNTYVKTDRIDKTNCDTIRTKQTPSLAFKQGQASMFTRENLIGGGAMKMLYVGDGQLYVVPTDNTSWCATFVDEDDDATANRRMYIGIVNSETEALATVPHTVKVRVDETDNYYAGEWDFVIES